MIENFEQTQESAIENQPTNIEKAAEARRSNNESLALFYENAKEGVEKPAYPDLVMEMRALYQRNKETITDSDKYVDIVLADTAQMINEWQKVSYPNLQPMSPIEVDKALFTYFGIQS